MRLMSMDVNSGCFCPFDSEEWDYLILLDACRYDYFSFLSKYFFKASELRKAWSCASNTLEFVINCLSRIREPEKVIYISANPYINSIRIFGKRYPSTVLHRMRIINAWLTLWNEQLGTVLPNKLTTLAKETIANNLDSKVVVHYLQPHAPYIHPKFLGTTGYAHPLTSPLTGSRELEYTGFLEFELKILKILGLLDKINLGQWKLAYIKMRKKLNLPPINPVDEFIRKYGISTLPIAYSYNLIIVLAYVALLVNFIKNIKPNAKIVITADHGECLGENGILEHPSLVMPCNRQIPVFEPRKVNIHSSSKYSLSWEIKLLMKLRKKRNR